MIKKEYVEVCNMCIIVNFGNGSKVINIAKENGINGGTIMLGRGTYFNKMLDFFGLNDTRKEIIWMVARKFVADKALVDIENKLMLKRKNTGIAFTTRVKMVVGIKNTVFLNNIQEEASVYQAIYTIVEKGRGNDVVEAASLAGAKGGTIIEARGAGSHESLKVFGIDIEPEKEIVLNLVPNERVEAIVEAIRTKLHIDEMGKGIIFVQAVSKIVGLSN